MAVSLLILKPQQVAQITNIQSLKLLAFHASSRVGDATHMGWPALAQSWQRDLDVIEARLEEVTKG